MTEETTTKVPCSSEMQTCDFTLCIESIVFIIRFSHQTSHFDLKKSQIAGKQGELPLTESEHEDGSFSVDSGSRSQAEIWDRRTVSDCDKWKVVAV